MDVFDPITATSALNTTRMSPAEQKQRATLITVNTEESYRIWSVWVETASAQRLMIDSSDVRADRYTVLYYIYIIENVLTPKKFLRKAKVAHLWLFTDSVLQFTVTLFISVDFLWHSPSQTDPPVLQVYSPPTGPPPVTWNVAPHFGTQSCATGELQPRNWKSRDFSKWNQ